MGLETVGVAKGSNSRDVRGDVRGVLVGRRLVLVVMTMALAALVVERCASSGRGEMPLTLVLLPSVSKAFVEDQLPWRVNPVVGERWVPLAGTVVAPIGPAVATTALPRLCESCMTTFSPPSVLVESRRACAMALIADSRRVA